MRRRFLVLSTLAALALVLTIGIEAALAGNADPQLVTLTVSVRGTGTGEVTSSNGITCCPPRFVCPSSCSGQYPVGTIVFLRAEVDAGSYWARTDGDCTRPRPDPPHKPSSGCSVTLTADTSIRFTFNLSPCDVPWAKGKTLAAAKNTLMSHDCTVGKITHADSRTIKQGRVISLKPKAGAHLKPQARVDLVVSKG